MAIESTGIGEGVMAIASGLLGIALIALILNRASDAGQLVQTSGQTFGNLLGVVINPGSRR